ncbi:MAG: tetratricopeptide repeat protein [Pirellulaceae bacterium]
MAHSPQPAAPTPRPSLAGRLVAIAPAWARNRKVASGLIVLLLVAMIGATFGVTLIFRGSETGNRQFLLAKALVRLDDGQLHEARQAATQLQALPDATLAERGGALFIQGSVLAREAENHSNPAQQRILYLVASRYLEEARAAGFPEGREADCLLVLARSLHRAGRYGQSLSTLRAAQAANPHAAAELHRLLAEGSLLLTPPRLDQARDHIQRYLALDDLTAAERHVGRLLESRILLARGDLPEAAGSLAQIPAGSPLASEAVMLRAKLAIESARQARTRQQELPADNQQSLKSAIAALRGLEARPSVDREQLAPAGLLIGHCYEMLADRRAAIAQFDRLRRARFGQPEGLAATLFQADLVRQEGRTVEAVAQYKQALQQAGPRESWLNPWLSLEELETRLRLAGDDLIAQGEHAAAVELAQAMPPLVSETLSLMQQIAAQHAWGEKLLAQAASEPAVPAAVTRAEARQHFRQAGADGQRLAALRIATRHYIDDLATAAENYQLGQGYRQAAHVYREFLRQNPQERRPEALVGLGQAQLTLGDTDEGLATLARCRDEFPTHPATYRARLLESLGWREKGDMAKARELLLDNLYRHSLTPKSSEWRDSIYALGHLLYLQARDEETQSRTAGVDQLDPEIKKAGLKLLEQSYASFQEAIRTLTEAVQRYPTARQTIEARYWIAESYRQAALWPRKKLTVTNIETSRLALNRQIQQELDAALEEYQKLLTELSDESQFARRTPVELAMLRNCYFGRADALFDLGRYDEAIQAYSAATNRYQHDPESLEAYVQIASCYRRLKRPNEARGTLEQARVVLQRIRPDADFLRTTRLDREQWTTLLTWLRTL